jgi:hypothetical protein
MPQIAAGLFVSEIAAGFVDRLDERVIAILASSGSIM